MLQQVFSLSVVHLTYHLFKGETRLSFKLGGGSCE